MVWLEPTLHDLLNEESGTAGQSMSGFLRSLLIDRLREHDKLPEEVLAVMLGGGIRSSRSRVANGAAPKTQ